MKMPSPPAEMVPELLIPPAKVAIVTDVAELRLPVLALLALPPMKMPLPSAEMLPELLIPPAKVVMVKNADSNAPEALALPPMKMPLLPAEMVPELLIPPAKVEIVTDTVWPLVVPGTNQSPTTMPL
jgi:hypothetical protein